MTPKWPQNDPKMTPKWPQNRFFQTVPTSFLAILGVVWGDFRLFWASFGHFWTRNAFKWPYLGSKMAQKWAKNRFSARSAKREARSAKRAQARVALEVWRICEPRSGSPMKERSRLRECDAHPEGIITMRLASRPIDYYTIWTYPEEGGGAPPKCSNFSSSFRQDLLDL